MTYQLTKNKYLLEPEFDELNKRCRSDLTCRNHLMILVALNTGTRAEELLQLKYSDLVPAHRSVFITGIKGSNDREIPLPKDIWVALMKYADANKDPSGLLFPITYQRLWQIWNMHRPTPKKFHCTRHTFAIRLYQKSKDLKLVQVMLGHKEISNTMIYMNYSYTVDEMRKWIA